MVKLNFCKSNVIVQTITINNRNNSVIIPKVGEFVNFAGVNRAVTKVVYLYKTDEEFVDEINIDIYLN